MRLSRVLILAVVGLWATAFGRDQFEVWVNATQLPVLAIETSQEIHDRNGALLRAYPASDGRWRLQTSIANVDPEFLRLLIRYEDKRFYDHSGVDSLALLRAAGQAFRNGQIVSGGSTLTMQVARLLEESGTGAWPGKLRQMRVAWALERQLSKQGILSLYLARAPYGGNLEGLRAASIAYFGKEPRRLTPTQSALLVALPQAPETRRPDRHPMQAKAARDRVLERLRSAGALPGDIRLDQPFTAKRRPFPQHAPHLADRLRTGKAVTETTIDLRLQVELQNIARRAAGRDNQSLSIAMMVADHQTGEILASVGSAGYANDGRGGFNDMTQAKRSPGSTLKPLIYGMGFDQGLLHPETLMFDRPTQFGTYAPQNFDGLFRGQIRVRQALQASLNLPVVSVLDRLGPSNLLLKLRQAGIQPDLPGGQPGLAIALGGLGLSLEDLVQLYAVLAQQRFPKTLTALPDASAAPRSPILSPKANWYVSDILREVPRPALASRKNVAYKTGTSYGHRDAWAIGFDGRHVVGVWMGRADGTPVPGAFGGELAAPILFKAFERISPDGTPLAAPPANALLIGATELPLPLRQFKARGEAVAGVNQPQVAFPPDGARVRLRNGLVTVQIRDGNAPFTWMQDGRPVLTRSWERQAQLRPAGRGFMDVTVIDAQGLTAATTIFAD